MAEFVYEHGRKTHTNPDQHHTEIIRAGEDQRGDPKEGMDAHRKAEKTETPLGLAVVRRHQEADHQKKYPKIRWTIVVRGRGVNSTRFSGIAEQAACNSAMQRLMAARSPLPIAVTLPL